jgi:hypothetical protein
MVFNCRACGAGFSHGRSAVDFRFVFFLSCSPDGGRTISLRCRTWFGAIFFSSLLYVGRPGLHASLARKRDVHWLMFISRLVVGNGHGMAWDKVNHQEDTTQQTLEMIPYGFSATIARIWKSNFHTKQFSMLLSVTTRKIFCRRSGDWAGGKGQWVGSGLALQPDRRSRSRSSSREHELLCSTISSEPQRRRTPHAWHGSMVI